MRFRQKICVALSVLAATVVGGPRALGQAGVTYGGYPSYQSGPARTGNNGNARNGGPGLANLNWAAPFNNTGVNPNTRPAIDDTDTNPVTVTVNGVNGGDGGPLQANPYGWTYQAGAAWYGPPDPLGYATFYTDPDIRTQPVVYNGTTYQPNYNLRYPPYHMQNCVPATSTTDPSQGWTSSFTWQFNGIPPASGGSAPAQTFAVYVNIPAGSTTNSLTNPPQTIWPQEFYVYVIRWGPGGSNYWIDTVDTYLTGGGLVRLGNGGLPTSLVFPYDGTNPITVTLYNTIPYSPTTGAISMPAPYNQWVVYADQAVFIPNSASTTATPVATRLTDTDSTTTVVTQVRNEVSVGAPSNQGWNLNSGVVYTYPYNGVNLTNPLLYNWRYAPLEEGPSPIFSTGVNSGGTTFPTDPNAIAYSGTAFVTPVVGQYGATNPPPPQPGTVTYAPTTGLVNGETYNLFAYIPGNETSPVTRTYSKSTLYEVMYDNGAGVMAIDYISVDQSVNTGWTQIGTRRYPNTTAVPLSVQVVAWSFNQSDVGLDAYANAFRFVGQANQSITSTPIHAYVDLALTSGVAKTRVTIIADENGVIHCLDTAGNPDGTTTEYWCYPSQRDSAGYDPNLGTIGGTGEDYGGNINIPAAQRTPTAEMPQGFGLSSALVVGDILYIGSVNGRVYAINMTGAGNYNSTDKTSGGYRKVGTTNRVWTYPATYPSATTYTTSDLQSIPGSVAYGAPNGVGTIFVPTSVGRIYAISAAGNPSDVSTTSVWKQPFPATTQRSVGSIVMTPLVAYNSIYFGCQQQALVYGTPPSWDTPPTSATIPGRFFSLDWATGAENWETNFPAYAPNPAPGIYPNYITPLDFISSPATASNNDLNPGSGITTSGIIYAINQNGVFYAIDSIAGGIQWATNELGAGTQGGLTFTWETVYDDNGSQNPYPVVMVPESTGQFVSLFAGTGTSVLGAGYTNIDGAYTANSYSTVGASVVASLATQDMGTIGSTSPPPTGYMFGADDAGFLYAFSNNPGGSFPYGQPGGNDIVPNNPAGDIFHKVRIAALPNLAAFQQLRQSPTTLTYAQTEALLPPDSTAPLATNNGFEWGQTMYVIVYRFPFVTTNTSGNLVDPPVVNISLSVNGKVVRGVSVQARQFAGTSPNYNSVNPTSLQDPIANPALDGYAVLAFPFQSSGANSLPPGSGQISATISTAALNSSGIQQNILMNPNVGKAGSGVFPFIVANPIAIVVPTPGASLSPTATALSPSFLPPSGPNGSPTNLYTFGVTNNPTDPENVTTGTFDATESPNGAYLGASTIDKLTHGGTGSMVFYVVDRSMMSLLRPNGLTQGLDNVRVQRSDLAWQGGVNAVIKPLSTSYYAQYAGFEDMPVNFPNDSLDYPDIHRQNVLATATPNSGPQNPLYNGVTLLPPLDASSTSNNLVALSATSNPQTRILRPTPFEIDFNIPKFQPANLQGSNSVINSAGVINPIQGYLGQLNVFVDSVGNGQLNTSLSEAYRSLNLSTSVDIDERLSVTTPTVDLGSIPGGAGYSAAYSPGSGFTEGQVPGANVFQPWGTGNYPQIFQPFGVENDGNTNLLDLRLAKISAFPNSNPVALAIPSLDTDMNAYLDASFDLWSNLDPAFSASPDTPYHRVFLQKARVQDRVPTNLVPNPIRRANQNLGTTGSVLVNGVTIPDVLNKTMVGGALLYDPNVVKPEIGVSIPIGFPVGKYVTQAQYPVRIFENDNGDTDVAPGTSTPQWDYTTAFGPQSAEPFTEGGITLSFNVVETRLTNTFTPDAEAMFDNLLPGGASGQFANSNIQPTGARDATGSLVVAWSSNRPSMTTSIQSPETDQYSIYLGSVANKGSFSRSQSGGITGIGGTSPMRDFDFWLPANASQWFNPAVQGYPSVAPSTLFGLNSGETLGAVRYGNPSFPSLGASDPFNPGNLFTGMYMAFTGEAQRQNADGSVQHESRLMLAAVGNSGGVATATAPVVDYNDDPLTTKGKPSVVETGTGSTTAMLFYPVSGGGQTSILYNTFNGSTFGRASALPFGVGFESVDLPSAVGRIQYPGFTGQQNVVELSFAGKLRGRPYADIYMGRLLANSTGTDLVRDTTGAVASTAFIDLPAVLSEKILADPSQNGLWRAQGAGWDTTANVALSQTPGGASVLVAGTGVYDNQTGIVSFDTTLGGKAYIDPSLGTIRFSNAIPSRNTNLYLAYTPRFLRISGGTTVGGVSGYSAPSTLFDSRLITDPTFWVGANGAAAGYGTKSQSGSLLINDRMVFTYNKAASGGSASRPYVTTMRFGVQLPYRIPTLTTGLPGISNGNTTLGAIKSITYADGGVSDAYQLDPASGGGAGAGVYFPASDEGRTVTIVAYAVDSSGKLIVDGNGNPLGQSTTAVISLVPEHSEAPLPIETSINETGLTAFLDPFTYANAGTSSNSVTRRPPLIYLIWASTRFGSPDLYMESVAPQWTPTIVQGN